MAQNRSEKIGGDQAGRFLTPSEAVAALQERGIKVSINTLKNWRSSGTRLGNALDSLNVRMMVSADNMSGDRLKTTIGNISLSAKMKDRVRVLAGINFQNVGPGWADKAIRQLASHSFPCPLAICQCLHA